MSEITSEEYIKQMILKEMVLNPKYVVVSKIDSINHNKFWITLPVGLTGKNLDFLQSKFKITMILPADIENIAALDLEVILKDGTQ